MPALVPVQSCLTYPPVGNGKRRRLLGEGRTARVGAARVVRPKLGSPLGTPSSTSAGQSRYQFALDEPALVAGSKTLAPAPWQQRKSSRGTMAALPSRTVENSLEPSVAKDILIWDTYIPPFDNEFWENMTL